VRRPIATVGEAENGGGFGSEGGGGDFLKSISIILSKPYNALKPILKYD